MTHIPEALRTVILTLTGASVGLAAYISFERAKAALTRDRWQAFYAMASAGFAIAVFLIGKLVYRSPGIPVSGDSVWYAVALTLAAIGYFGIALDQRRRNRRREDP